MVWWFKTSWFKNSFIHSFIQILLMWIRKWWQNLEFWFPFLLKGQADHIHVVKTLRKDHIDSQTSHPPHIYNCPHTDLLCSHVSQKCWRETTRPWGVLTPPTYLRVRSEPCLNLYGSVTAQYIMWSFWIPNSRGAQVMVVLI